MTLLGVDPSLVRPGWAPALVVVLLGIVLFFLGRSMLKQFGKIDVPADHEPAPGSAASPPPGPAEPGDAEPGDPSLVDASPDDSGSDPPPTAERTRPERR